ncbi:uncharacterized protein EI90DRAFT_481170 [Cantharellus anzutake]|uniref:uncharacterized protein n=1 Tax=Cantharellus anzutake TaxID=1750568 RepID=UPI0019075D50|nr:uncharacterized protein EI90DRAFT_481170 [Cantharellus anzutake]KAF8313906.1 hypothetical protein EI90DRAFT_481170 [Cantharellus anzutake]
MSLNLPASPWLSPANDASRITGRRAVIGPCNSTTQFVSTSPTMIAHSATSTIKGSSSFDRFHHHSPQPVEIRTETLNHSAYYSNHPSLQSADDHLCSGDQDADPRGNPSMYGRVKRGGSPFVFESQPDVQLALHESLSRSQGGEPWRHSQHCQPAVAPSSDQRTSSDSREEYCLSVTEMLGEWVEEKGVLGMALEVSLLGLCLQYFVRE